LSEINEGNKRKTVLQDYQTLIELLGNESVSDKAADEVVF
jgi:hypothetical protein